MGFAAAYDMAEAVTDDTISLDVALSWHLTSNHYPPLPTFFIPTCKDAIAKATEGDWDSDIPLPDGIEWKDGRDVVNVGAFVESFHLDAFVGGF